MKKARATEKGQSFHYSGRLSDTPLPDILCTISQYKVPGVLSLTNRKITKQIFIHERKITFAVSNSPDDHLGEFLLKCGKITRGDYDRSVQLLKQSEGKWQGQILIEMKALSPDELPWAVKSHQQAIVWSLFDWFEGEVQFRIGNYHRTKPIRLDVPIPRAILDGVRHVSQAKRIINYMGSRNTVLEAAEDALLTVEMYEADDKERDILKMVDGKTTLYDLCAKGPYPAAEIARVLYGLFSLKLVRRKEHIQVVSSLPDQNFI